MYPNGPLNHSDIFDRIAIFINDNPALNSDMEALSRRVFGNERESSYLRKSIDNYFLQENYMTEFEVEECLRDSNWTYLMKLQVCKFVI